MADNEDDFLTQEEIAKELNVPIEKVRATVTALSAVGLVKTMRSPRDRRFLLVHKDALETLRKAIYNT
jgi:DNA-binding MarR family transcriptional regulator